MPNCNLCHQRPPRRHCPALNADICAPCCGEERERSLVCPFHCEYLLQAREREPVFELPAKYPNQDLDTGERFLRTQEPLLLTMVGMLFFASVKANALDLDVRAAIDAMIRERRGLPQESALTETPANLKAEFEERFAEFHAKASAEGAVFSDSDVVRILAFFQREEMHYNNQRPKSRAYVDWLRGWVSSMADAMQQPTTDGS